MIAWLFYDLIWMAVESKQTVARIQLSGVDGHFYVQAFIDGRLVHCSEWPCLCAAKADAEAALTRSRSLRAPVAIQSGTEAA